MEADVPRIEQSFTLGTDKSEDATQTFLKLEALQTIHNPIPANPLPVPKPENKSFSSIPYDRIGGLVDGEHLYLRYCFLSLYLQINKSINLYSLFAKQKLLLATYICRSIFVVLLHRC